MHSLRRTVRKFTFLAGVLVTLIGVARPARAVVNGQAPAPFDSFRVFGDGIAIGNTLMENPPPNLQVNTELLPESTAAIASRGSPSRPTAITGTDTSALTLAA